MAFGSSNGNGDNGDDADEFTPLADINMTPFIDVMLVLLVIFMMTASILATGMKVELPKAAAAKPIENQKPVVITVSADEQIQVNGRAVVADALAAAVRDELAGADRVIQIRGDQGVRYGSVVRILDALTAAGMNKVALVAERANTNASATTLPSVSVPVAADHAGHDHSAHGHAAPPPPPATDTAPR